VRVIVPDEMRLCERGRGGAEADGEAVDVLRMIIRGTRSA
jgi:hypothetical protein